MKTSFARKQKQLLGPGPCTPVLGADPFSTAMGTHQDQSHKNAPKRCRKQQPSFRLPPNPILHSRIKALKVGSVSLQLKHRPTPGHQHFSCPQDFAKDLDAPENGQHPSHSPACSFPLSLFPVAASAASLPSTSPSTHRDVAHHLNWELPPWLMAQGKSLFPVLEHPKPQQDGWDEAQAS